MKPVHYEIEKHTAFITLNTPETGNTVNCENLELIKDYIREAVTDDGVRAIVLQGKDGVFCRGMDFTMLFKPLASVHFTVPYMETVLAIHNAEKPVICLVDGEVLAGGMGLVCASDIVLCSETATFGLSEVYFGLVPAYVFPLLLERVAFKKARYLAISSRKIDAREALSIGLADDVVPSHAMKRTLKEYLQRILFSSPEAISLVKRYSDTLLEQELSSALGKARIQLESLLKNKKNLDAIKAFQAGEPLPWSMSYRKS
jgi:polyketide biosynthesis enoyl-CoA hydratase PksH